MTISPWHNSAQTSSHTLTPSLKISSQTGCWQLAIQQQWSLRPCWPSTDEIKFGHVEAGLRTHNKWHPFPEEINRRLATVTADLHFAPTAWSQGNLLREGVDEKAIIVTGNSVIDALKFVSKQAEPQETKDILAKLGNKKIILVTAHRRENFGKPLENICHALKELASREDVEIVYPVHLNPNVQEPVNRILKDVPNITLLPPLDYLPLVHLMKHATLILTDSGGNSRGSTRFWHTNPRPARCD